MARKAQPKSKPKDRVLRPDLNREPRPRFGSTTNERKAEAAQRIQSIPSVDAGLSAPRGMSSATNRNLVSLPVDHSRLPQSPNVRPEDRAPNLFRPAGSTVTRGHGAAAALAAEVNRHQYLFGKTIYPSEATVAVERHGGGGVRKTEDIGLGTDVQPRDKTGMQAKRQIAAIATPAGLRGDRMNPGATGVFAGASEADITAAGLVETRIDAVGGMARGSEVRPPRAEGVQRFRAGEQPSPISPKMKERMSTVTVSKGKVETDESGKERLVPTGRRTTMSNADHAKRAEKQIAKRKKAEEEA